MPHRGLGDPAHQTEAMALIRSLVEAIVLMPENGALTISLKGELAGILDLRAKGQKAGSAIGAGFAEQIKLAAGREATEN